MSRSPLLLLLVSLSISLLFLSGSSQAHSRGPVFRRDFAADDDDDEYLFHSNNYYYYYDDDDEFIGNVYDADDDEGMYGVRAKMAPTSGSGRNRRSLRRFLRQLKKLSLSDDNDDDEDHFFSRGRVKNIFLDLSCKRYVTCFKTEIAKGADGSICQKPSPKCDVYFRDDDDEMMLSDYLHPLSDDLSDDYDDMGKNKDTKDVNFKTILERRCFPLKDKPFGKICRTYRKLVPVKSKERSSSR